MIMEKQYMKENIQMEKEMEKEKNIILMVGLKDNIKKEKNGMVQDIDGDGIVIILFMK